MTDTAVEEILDDVFSALEALETQTGAILQFLKDRSLVNDEDLAPFWEKAASASNVRWRAARVRINHLLSAPSKGKDIPQQKPSPAADSGKDKQAASQAPESSGGPGVKEKPAPGSGEASRPKPETTEPPQKKDDRGPEETATDRPGEKQGADQNPRS